MFYIFIRNYCFHINFIDDLTTASILELVYPFFYVYTVIFLPQALLFLNNNKSKL